MSGEITKAMAGRTLVFDGAMGTMLQAAGVASDCNEELCLAAPDVVADVHRAYLGAGADVIITNTFGASRIALAEHGMAGRVREINEAAAKIALREARAAGGPPRFVAGELGPTSKLPTLGHISFEELCRAYAEQALALAIAGVDLIITSTSQDPLQVKAALAAVQGVREERGIDLPVVVSVTIEPAGRMLLGTELTAALAAVAPYRPLAFGINCATGPDAMGEHMSALARVSPFPIICQPNAGMPENVGGELRYTLEPEEFAKALAGFAERFGLELAGGCCGTTPDHIRALAKRLKGTGRGTRDEGRGTKKFEAVSSLYTAYSLDQEPRPFIVAEQTNVNGSKGFRELMLADDYDAMADAGKRAAEAGHALDLCLAYAGRDEARDMAEAVARLAPKADAAIMVDTTRVEALTAALALAPGRCIVNSINLEDGGERAVAVMAIARRYGAAVVGLCIDEDGMAKGADRKLAVAKRIVGLAESHGLARSDLLIDPLTFTLASGDPELVMAGRETLEAVRNIKRELPGVRVILGVSNISFGLPVKGRRFLNSAFLHRAIGCGLDAAIINPARVVPMDRIPGDVLAIVERLIDGGRDGDPLARLIGHIEGMDGLGGVAMERESPSSPEEALRFKVLDGARDGLAEIVDDLLKCMKPAEIINGVLLPAMQEVGKSFGEGRRPLPFVLHSAETMRAAIDLIAPHMEAGDQVHRGTIVLATVRGDVHDIGKNLVDAILSNNGFKVVNLGIRQPAKAVAEATREHRADAIGLSGLLVSSVEIMREDLEIFQEAGISVPVLCGGAALTRSYVDEVLSRSYGGRVAYCADAFSGLEEMERIESSKVKGERSKVRQI